MITHKLVNAIKDNNLIIFIGSGFSKSLGFPDWRVLVLKILEHLINEGLSNYADLKKPVHSGMLPLLTVIDLLKPHKKHVREVLKTVFSVDCKKKDLTKHKKIWMITDKVITTNFDYALETSLDIKPISHNYQYELSQLSKQDKFLFKIHGSIDDVANCILFTEDYVRIYTPPTAAIKELENLMRNRTILFIGFSMSDPYLQYVFSYLNAVYNGFLDSHYIMTTKEDDFSEYNIVPIILKSYDEIDTYLDEFIKIKNSNSKEKEIKLIKVDNLSNKKRFLRRRCRLIANGSKKFRKIISDFNNEKFDLDTLDKYKSEIVGLEPTFEKPLALAAYHENIGKIEQMERILSNFQLQGIKESVRLLYRAIASEKQDKLEDAIEDIYHILRIEKNTNILRAAQFNLNVCYEKKEEYDKVDFAEFFDDKKIKLIGNERICDKAITMHLIFCEKTGSAFLYDDRLNDTLEYEIIHSPVGYAKTLLAYASYKKTKLLHKEFELIFGLRSKMSINQRVAILIELCKHLDINFHRDMIVKIINNVKLMYEKSRSMTVRKYIDEMERHLKSDDKN